MNCPDRLDLSLWLDGELPPEKTGEFERHLQECSHCRKAVEAQQRMESLWRGSWKDPDETAFTMMRKGLIRTVPWWKRQRNWMAVAAVFAVYFGVRIFLIDNAGTSMSDLAVEELADLSENQSVHDAPEVFVTAEAETREELVEEMAALEPVEAVTDELIIRGDIISPSPGSSDEQNDGVEEMEEEMDICLSLSDDTAGLSMAQTNIEEPVSYGSSLGSDDIGSEVSEDFEGVSSGLCGGSSTGAGGGGSGGLTGTISSSEMARSEDDHQEAMPAAGEASCEVERNLSCQECSAAVAKDSLLYSVSAELTSGQTVALSRGNWISLFQLIDSYIEQYGVTGQTLYLSIDPAGNVSGDELLNGAVIDVPTQEYVDCTFTVSVF